MARYAELDRSVLEQLYIVEWPPVNAAGRCIRRRSMEPSSPT
jgi:hypothetical protein